MASTAEIRSLILDAENVLRERRRTTADEAEKRALKEAIDALRLELDALDLADLGAHAAALNGLATTLEGAVRALRQRPFDQVLGQLQKLFDRIGAAQGHVPRALPEPVAAVVVAPLVEPAAVEPMAAAAEPVAGDDVPTRLAALFASCKVRPERLVEIDRFYVEPLLAGRRSYEQVGTQLAIPWWFVGIVHGLEGGYSFETHLHNGDPLTARTVHVPAGRPEAGAPPFPWVDSANDALTLRRLGNLADWSVGAALDRLERYNGLGYRNRGLASPYLWSFSTHYTKGKFVEDGVFDPDFVSKQCGGAVVLRRLVELKLVALDGRSGEVEAARALAAGSVDQADPLEQVPAFATKTTKAEVAFPGVVGIGAKANSRPAWQVQAWCNLNGTATSLDGVFGEGTADAVRRFQADRGIPATGSVDERSWIELTGPVRRVLARIAAEPGATLNDVVTRVARQHLAQHPRELIVAGESNSGPWVRLYMNGKEGEDQLWCAGFVCFVVGQAAAALGMAMPFPRQVGVDALVKDARASGRFVAERDLPTGMARRTRLRPGMLFVRRRAAGDWTHTGIVTEIGDTSFRSIEGNTNDEGSDNGFEVCERSRSYDGKDFIALV